MAKKKTSRSKTKTSKASAKKARGGTGWFTYKDLAIVYTTKGLSGVKALYGEGKIKAGMLKRTAEMLDSKELKAYALENAPAGVRGRTAPAVGDERAYKAQQVSTANGGMSTLFVRLPVETVVSKKGQALSVSFEKGKIVLTAG